MRRRGEPVGKELAKHLEVWMRGVVLRAPGAGGFLPAGDNRAGVTLRGAGRAAGAVPRRGGGGGGGEGGG